MAYKTIQYDERENVRTVRLSRTERRNAISRIMVEELMDCFSRNTNREDIRSIILTGSGKAFCSDGDTVETCPSKGKGFSECSSRGFLRDTPGT
jgi:enoyl-CoA hydratase/carnithine racemase